MLPLVHQFHGKTLNILSALSKDYNNYRVINETQAQEVGIPLDSPHLRFTMFLHDTRSTHLPKLTVVG